jgi:hypothetical protein
VKGSNQEYAYVSSAIGGSLSQISFGDNEFRTPIATPYNGGVRGRVRGFSRASRRNLLRRLASINRTAFRDNKGRLIPLTLTYPSEYPKDPEVCKNHLKAFRKRLEREFGSFSGFWRMGIQQRGAWHFHLLLFLPRSAYKSIQALRNFVASSWYEVCGKICESQLLAGTRIEEIRKWKQATSYMEKYVAKEEVFPEGVETGRIWGVWNEKLLPVEWQTVKVNLKDAYRIRRIFRRLAKMRGIGSLQRMTVFVRYENVLRLLEFLGYRTE